MKRRVANVAAGASLAVCVAASALWARSHRIVDYLSNEGRGGKEVAVLSDRGRLLFLSLGRDDAWPGAVGWTTGRASVGDPKRHYLPGRARDGFGYVHWGHRTNRFVMLEIPHWSPAAADFARRRS